MRSQFGVFRRDWEFMIEEKEKPPPPLPEAPEPSTAIKGKKVEMTTLGEEKLRLASEIEELAADITRQLAELPRWLRWLMRKGWPSIFKNL